MKKLILIIGISTLIITACDQAVNLRESNETTKEKNYVLSQVNGIDVLLKNGIPMESLNYTEDDYRRVISSSVIGARNLNAMNTRISLQELHFIYDQIIESYGFPDLIALSALNQNAVSNAKADFPNLSEKEIRTNIAKIIEIYEEQVRYAIYMELSNNLLSSNTSRASEYPGGVNDEEFWLLFWNPLNIDGTERAASKSSSWAKEKFPSGSQWRDQADAFRHSSWNALICCYVPGNKSAKISWAKKITNAHENGSPAPDDIRDNAMDFHNNREGREYFDDHSSNEFLYVDVPSDSKVKKALFSKAQSAILFSSNDQLPALKGNMVYFQ